jgi:hypothetical protein
VSRSLSERTALLLAAGAAALPHWRALVPGLSYYFRDFSVTFYPLRLFQARELAQGRLAFWNPYIHEGSFVLPALYPAELLHALWPGPAAVSWLLTLHVPLAAAAAYLLARELGARREGALVAGAIYGLGGLCASSLNLYVFLQALAWAPALAAASRRAALRGGRWAALLAPVTAVSLSTMAVEFVGQAVLAGLALGLCAAPRARALARMGLGLALGAGLAAVPLAVTAGFLGETVRGGGFAREVALGNELHPLALLQVLVPNLFGALDAPAELWWGGRFFTKGFPYFLSVYLGAIPLALAAAGWPRLPRPTRLALGALAVLGLWYALGARGGLASALNAVPALRWIRFPSKALLLPCLALVPLAAAGFDRLRSGEGWTPAWRWLLGLALIAALPALAFTLAPAWAESWAGVPSWAAGRVRATSVIASVLALAAAGAAAAAARGAVRVGLAAWLLAAIALADLARAHAGMNPQVSPRFYEPLPEMAALRLADEGRVFSYGPDESPAFRRFLNSGARGLALWSFFVNRQLLGPYNNILDRVQTPEAKDLTSLVPRPPLFEAADYDPAAVGAVVERLREAAVAHVLSLDPLAHPALRERASVSTGQPGLDIHVYRLDGLPRAYVACGAAAIEGATLPAGCRKGAARPVDTGRPDVAAYEVELDGAGFLVTRDSYARGWRATVDGRPAPVLRAEGWHRAVPVPAGRHAVRLAYHPPGLRAGVALMVAAALATAGVAWRPRSL